MGLQREGGNFCIYGEGGGDDGGGGGAAPLAPARPHQRPLQANNEGTLRPDKLLLAALNRITASNASNIIASVCTVAFIRDCQSVAAVAAPDADGDGGGEASHAHSPAEELRCSVVAVLQRVLFKLVNPSEMIYIPLYIRVLLSLESPIAEVAPLSASPTGAVPWLRQWLADVVISRCLSITEQCLQTRFESPELVQLRRDSARTAAAAVAWMYLAGIIPAAEALRRVVNPLSVGFTRNDDDDGAKAPVTDAVASSAVPDKSTATDASSSGFHVEVLIASFQTLLYHHELLLFLRTAGHTHGEHKTDLSCCCSLAQGGSGDDEEVEVPAASQDTDTDSEEYADSEEYIAGGLSITAASHRGAGGGRAAAGNGSNSIVMYSNMFFANKYRCSGFPANVLDFPNSNTAAAARVAANADAVMSTLASILNAAHQQCGVAVVGSDSAGTSTTSASPQRPRWPFRLVVTVEAALTRWVRLSGGGASLA